MSCREKPIATEQIMSTGDDKTKAAETAEPEPQSKEADYKELLQRLQAEFENYKKRAAKEQEAARAYSNSTLLLKFLPVLDSFEMALKNSTDAEKFRKGVELIYAQFHTVLESEGLRPIEAAGKPFDPFKHEVLMQEPAEHDGIVLEEFQKGYLLKDIVLRHSKVKVGVKHDDQRRN